MRMVAGKNTYKNLKICNFSIFICILSFSINSYSQVDYDKIKSYKLNPTHFDTINEATLVIKKRYAILYFKQSDLKEYLKPYNTLGIRIDLNHENIKSLLKSSCSKIVLTDWWGEYTDEEKNYLTEREDYDISEKKYLDEIYYTCADLIYHGKFMIIDRTTKQEIIKRLKIKRAKGLYGTRYAEFKLPSGKSFWSIVSRIGE